MKPTEKKFDTNPLGTLVNTKDTRKSKYQLFTNAKLVLPSPDIVINTIKDKCENE